MSSPTVYKGLQSRLEPHAIEPRVLSLKLALQDTILSPPPINKKCVTIHDAANAHVNGESRFSFLQTLSHDSHCSSAKTEDHVYVHPTVKRSSSMLSDKSLEMCTESLGCETGSNAGEVNDDVSSLSLHSDAIIAVRKCESKRAKRACGFPPPLTSITDFSGVRVRPRREGGRLILEAFTSPSQYFHAERGDGRLRLRFLESFSASENDHETVEDVEEEEEEEEEEEDDDDNKINGETEMNKEEKDSEEKVEKFERPSRCKESGNRDIFSDALVNLNFPMILSVSE